MKPTLLRRLTAGLTIAAAAITGSLLTISPAAADDPVPATDGTTVTDTTDDTWWGSQPTNPAPAEPTEPTATPMDTWWG